MKCEICQGLLWDFDECSLDEQKEIIEHLSACEICRKEYALIQRVQKSDLPMPFSVADKTIAILKKEKTPMYKSFLKYSLAASVVIIASLVFLLPNLNAKTENDAALDVKFENTVDDGATGVTNGALLDKVESEDIFTEPEYVADAELPAEPETPMTEKAPSAEIIPPDPDEQMLLNMYKDTFSISSHTADVVLSGIEMNHVSELVSSLSPTLEDTHLVIEGDAALELLDLLKKNGITPLYVTLSETVRKTIIYFEENLK